VNLRIATLADADAVARLHADSWRRTYRGSLSDEYLDGDVVADRLAVWHERLGSPASNQHVIVAEENGVLQAFICVYGDRDDRWGSLVDNLHVRFDAHGRGIGRELMRAAAAWSLASYPGSGLYLWVLQANQNGQRFYERLGGSNQGGEEHEGADGGTTYALRYAWADPRALATS
jgi:GNAT superfamily N-acetyltransferase